MYDAYDLIYIHIYIYVYIYIYIFIYIYIRYIHIYALKQSMINTKLGAFSQINL